VKAKVKVTLEKYKCKSEKPYETLKFQHETLLSEGVQELFKLITSLEGTKYDSDNAYIGVGDGTTPASRDQVGLQGVNTFHKGMTTGYPKVQEYTGVTPSTYEAVWRSLFEETEANFSWQELTVVNIAGKNLLRLVQDMGTKPSGEIWVLTVELYLV